MEASRAAGALGIADCGRAAFSPAARREAVRPAQKSGAPRGAPGIGAGGPVIAAKRVATAQAGP